MTPDVSPLHRAHARTAFVRALARHTSAIRELRAIRLCGTERAAEREAAHNTLDRFVEAWQRDELPDGCAEHMFDRAAVIDLTEVLGAAEVSSDDAPDPLEGAILPTPSPKDSLIDLSYAEPFNDLHARLLEVAAQSRVNAVNDWSARAHLDAPWLRTWALYATLRWDTGRECAASDCRYGCDRARADDLAIALEVVLSPWAMLYLVDERRPAPDEDGSLFTSIALTTGDWRPTWQRPIVSALVGPHPQLETREQFRARAEAAYDEALRLLVELGDKRDRKGRETGAPRAIEQHAEWCARRVVNGEPARRIYAHRTRGDESTVEKGIRAFAKLIDLPLRRK